MTSLFSSCFSRSSKSSAPLLEPPSPSAAEPSTLPNCVFCSISPDRFNIVLETPSFICFTDRSPAARTHLLVIPRAHITNVSSLTSEHSELVRDMQALGNKALDLVSEGAGERRFGFHIPPFRSVDHLHLHCLELPFRSRLKALKYRVAEPPSADYKKGWSWFAEWRQTCALLEAGRKVKVSSC